MNKERAIYFAGLMEEYLNIPSCVCESIENELINEKYNKVINYLIDRRKELENKANYKSYRDIVNMYLQLQQENKQLKEQVIIMEKYLELIYDLGYDYDGLNQVDSLKTLIDELVKYASFGRVCNLTEPVYENNGVSYNILHQELEKSDSNE